MMCYVGGVVAVRHDGVTQQRISTSDSRQLEK